MAYDEPLADRVRRVLAARPDVEEKRMFGGLAFLSGGRMCCGIVRDTLMVRADPDECERLLQEPHVRPMDFTGRPMRGFLYVEPEGVGSATALRRWVTRSLTYVDALPPKPPSKTRAPAGARGGTSRPSRGSKGRMDVDR